MKTLNELRTTLNEHDTDARGPHLYSPGFSPPNILILKRKTVRSYSSTERVALYYNEKLQRYFSVPFSVGREDSRDDVVGVSEEVELTEDAISHLQKVKAFQTDKPLYHKDGTQTKVDPTTAHALLTVHGALHPDNQKKMADAMEHSKHKFHKILDFAWKQVK